MKSHDSALAWRRSRRCDNGHCIEVAQLATGIALRDSTRPEGATLRFSQGDWTHFLADVRAGRL